MKAGASAAGACCLTLKPALLLLRCCPPDLTAAAAAAPGCCRCCCSCAKAAARASAAALRLPCRALAAALTAGQSMCTRFSAAAAARCNRVAAAAGRAPAVAAAAAGCCRSRLGVSSAVRGTTTGGDMLRPEEEERVKEFGKKREEHGEVRRAQVCQRAACCVVTNFRTCCQSVILSCIAGMCRQEWQNQQTCRHTNSSTACCHHTMIHQV